MSKLKGLITYRSCVRLKGRSSYHGRYICTLAASSGLCLHTGNSRKDTLQRHIENSLQQSQK